MDQGSVTYLDYASTGAFGGWVTDYLRAAPALQAFYRHPPNLQGLREAVATRRMAQPDRALLCQAIRATHASMPLTSAQQSNLEALTSPNTFTICTAHQPNIFSGYLYFIYKILHAIRLADDCARDMPDCRFVPVFWMGSEDNDLDELGQIRWYGQKLVWQTKQTGAVGRMVVDAALQQLIGQMAGTIGVEPFGKDIIHILQDAYPKGITIAEATTRFIQHLFADYGLLVLQPDQPALKRVMVPVFRKELESQVSHGLVAPVATAMDAIHKAQLHPREVNLFWIDDAVRGRIIPDGDRFLVDGTSLSFTKDEILRRVEDEPEKFSPNVVLRGLYQETVLPGIAFIGGGSEVAYWLELKTLFDHFEVPYPVVLLRNSFLLLDAADRRQLLAMGLSWTDLFTSTRQLLDTHARQYSDQRLDMEPELEAAARYYAALGHRARALDPTLEGHVQSIAQKAIHRLRGLEAKMLRAERRKHSEWSQKLERLHARLFPNGSLQERHDNIIPYLAKYGPGVIQKMYQASRGCEMQFGVIDL